MWSTSAAFGSRLPDVVSVPHMRHTAPAFAMTLMRSLCQRAVLYSLLPLSAHGLRVIAPYINEKPHLILRPGGAICRLSVTPYHSIGAGPLRGLEATALCMSALRLARRPQCSQPSYRPGKAQSIRASQRAESKRAAFPALKSQLLAMMPNYTFRISGQSLCGRNA